MTKSLLPLLLLLLLAACAPRPVTFDHAAYSPAGNGIYRSASGQELRVEAGGDGTRVSVGGQVYQVRGSAQQVEVTFPDGRALTTTYLGNGSSTAAGVGVKVSLEDSDRVDELREIVFGRQAQGESSGLARVIYGLLLAGFGALEAVKPRLAFQIAEGWRYKNLEPSEAFLALSRVGGVVMIVVGVALAVGILG